MANKFNKRQSAKAGVKVSETNQKEKKNTYFLLNEELVHLNFSKKQRKKKPTSMGMNFKLRTV